MKKIFSLILIIIFALSTITVQGVSGAETYDITVSDGTEESLQSALYRAKDVATTEDPYVIHVTKSMSISRGLSVYSNTKIVSDAGVVYTREMPVDTKKVMLRFGDLGSYSSGYYYKNITIKGGVWDGNGSKADMGFCIFKLAHAQNVTLDGCTFKRDVEGHMVEVGAVNTMTVKNCTFKDHISLDSSYEHEEALQLDVNLQRTTEMGYFDKYQIKNITVTGCTFNNVGRGVGSHNSVEGLYFTNMHIDNNTFTNLKSYAVSCVNYRNSTIKNNKMNSCGGGILFMNIKNNYKSASNSYVMKEWNLKLNTSKDNSVISGNIIKQSKRDKDTKCIILYGDKVPEDYGDTYIKGDHCINGVTLSNNTIYSPQYTAVLLSDAKNCNVKNNKIYYTGKGGKCYGIFMKNKCYNTTVTGNYFSKCFDGVTALDSSLLNVSSNKFESGSRNGITLIRTKNSIVKNNKIKFTGKNGKNYGVFLEDYCDGTSVTGNTIKNGFDGITTTKSKSINISSNTISASSRDGITCIETSKSTVKDNKITFTGKKSKNYGIFLEDKCDGTSVTNNSISKGFDGITTTNSKSVNISSNTISACSRDGITCIGTVAGNVAKNKISCSGKGKSSYGIFLENKSNRTSVKGNKLIKCYDGITITNSNSLKISSNTITSTQRNGITCQGTKESSFSKNTITNATSQGMYFERAKASVTNCTINKVFTNHGINTNSKDCDLKITGCTIKNCMKYGIAVSQGKATIKNCKFSGNKSGNISKG